MRLQPVPHTPRVLNKEDVWADLRYALDELNRPPCDIHSRLTEAASLAACGESRGTGLAPARSNRVQ